MSPNEKKMELPNQDRTVLLRCGCCHSSACPIHKRWSSVLKDPNNKDITRHLLVCIYTGWFSSYPQYSRGEGKRIKPFGILRTCGKAYIRWSGDRRQKAPCFDIRPATAGCRRCQSKCRRNTPNTTYAASNSKVAPIKVAERLWCKDNQN